MPGFGALLSGHRLLDRYRIGAVIGRGGFAVVYEALDERLDRNVAVKVITIAGPEGSLEEEMQARFQREARTSAGLQHRNVVAIYDFGTDPALGLDFLVMERLRGEDLRTRLRRADPIPAPQAMHVLASAAAGVAAGHQAGIIHRDVKPANIFLTDSPELRHHRVCVLDFGIAFLAAADDTTRITRNGIPLSVPYASPEQLAGEGELGPETDVFSLGAVAYELLTRRRAFSNDPLAAQQERVDPLAPIVELNPEVPAHVAAAVHRALHPDRTERFPDAEAFALALNASIPLPAPAPAPIPDVVTRPVAPAPAPPPPLANEPHATPAAPAAGRRRLAPIAAAAAIVMALGVGGSMLLAGNGEGGDPPTAARAEQRAAAGDSAVVDSAEVELPADSAAARATRAGGATAPAPGASAARTAGSAPAGTPPAASSAPATVTRTAQVLPPAPAARRPAATPSAPPAAPPRAAGSLPASPAPEFRENLTHRCQSLPSATEASACLQRDLAVADDELNAVYQRVMASLPAGTRQALRESQRAWLLRYDRVLTSYYSTPWGDHSRVEVLPSQIQAVRDRTAYLRTVESAR